MIAYNEQYGVQTHPHSTTVLPRLEALSSQEQPVSLSSCAEASGRCLCGDEEGHVSLHVLDRDEIHTCVEKNRVEISTQRSPVSSISLLSNTQCVATQESGHVTLFDDRLQELRTLKLSSVVRDSDALSANSAILACSDGLLHQWDTRQQAPGLSLQIPGESFRHVEVSRNAPSQVLTSSAWTGVARVHDLRRTDQCISSASLGYGCVVATFVQGLVGDGESVLVSTRQGELLSMPVTLDSKQVILGGGGGAGGPMLCAAYERSLRILVASSASGYVTVATMK